MGKRESVNWWSRRFLAVLDSYGLHERLTRGRTYARQGRVLDLLVAPGLVEAKVQGYRSEPYRVAIHFRPLQNSDWIRVTEILILNPNLVTALLVGEVSPTSEQIQAQISQRLFPQSEADLTMSCSCPDWVSPCKHVAAVYFTLAAELETDPLLIVELRGRTRETLFGNIKASWDSNQVIAPWKMEERRTRQRSPAVTDPFWTAGAAVESMSFRFKPTSEPGALLDAIKLPAELQDEKSLITRLKGYYQNAAQHSQKLERLLIGGQDPTS